MPAMRPKDIARYSAPRPTGLVAAEVSTFLPDTTAIPAPQIDDPGAQPSDFDDNDPAANKYVRGSKYIPLNTSKKRQMPQLSSSVQAEVKPGRSRNCRGDKY